MRTISPALLSHIRGSVLTLAVCWRLQRRDGLVLGFTDHDAPLIVNGETYEPEAGIAPTTTVTQVNSAVGNGNLLGVLNSDMLTEDDLENGRWREARVEMFLVNWQSPADGTIPLLRGEIGEVKLGKGARFDVEVRSLGSRLQKPVGHVYSRTCPATECSCLLELCERPENVVTGVVDGTVFGQRVFTDATRTEPECRFRYGRLTWLTGENAGLSEEVYSYEPGVVSLAEAMPRPIAVGDTYRLARGVDGELETCVSFNNVAQFRGFPYILGPDKLLSTVDGGAK